MTDKDKKLVNDAVEILLTNYQDENIQWYLLANIDNAMTLAEMNVCNKYGSPCMYTYYTWKKIYNAIVDTFINILYSKGNNVD